MSKQIAFKIGQYSYYLLNKLVQILSPFSLIKQQAQDRQRNIQNGHHSMPLESHKMADDQDSMQSQNGHRPPNGCPPGRK